MKPRIFIGSSNEQRELAGALATAMQGIALGSPWNGDVFTLGQGTVDDLEKEAAKSDFAVFIFAADDMSKIRGTEHKVTRDNVVYELGLFTGCLGKNRCYGLIASGTILHLPSDIWGLTLGTYDPEHGESRVAAVTPFVHTRLAERVRTLGFRHKAEHHKLYDLIMRYSCCDEFLYGDGKEQVSIRLAEKSRIWSEMRKICKAMPANKDILLDEHHYVALAAAIVSNPEDRDFERITKVRRDLLKRGDPQAKIVDAMIALRISKEIITDQQRNELADFAESFTNQDSTLCQHIRNFRNL